MSYIIKEIHSLSTGYQPSAGYLNFFDWSNLFLDNSDLVMQVLLIT